MQDDASNASGDRRLVSLVTLFTPMNLADALTAEPAHLEDEALKRLHELAKTAIESFDNWTRTFDAQPDQFTPLGYEVFNRFFQSFASFLRTDWKSEEFHQTKSALRTSIAAVRTAFDAEPLITAHLELRQHAGAKNEWLQRLDKSSEA